MDHRSLRPSTARARFRGGVVAPTTGWASGWTQANLICVPRSDAWDLLLFAQRNPRSCPVLDVLDAGEVAGPLLDGDVRTDVPAYRVYADLEVPDYGDRVELSGTDVPVFWACGVTPQAAVRESRPPLAISHAPGHMLITDARDSAYQVP